jgi:hypothetical protein
MTATPTDADLGRFAVALDDLLRDPRLAEVAAAVRAVTPIGLRDQLDAAADEQHRHLQAETAALNGEMHYTLPEDTPMWITLGAVGAFVEWAAGRGSTCMHNPQPSRPQPVVAAAWRSGLVTCTRCVHLFNLPRGSDADRRCDGCGHLTTGLEHDDGITPARLGTPLLTYMAGVCVTCRWWTP